MIDKLNKKCDRILSSAKNKKWLFAITVIISFIAIFILNYLLPLLNDDWMYSFFTGENILTGAKTPPIASLSDVFHSQYAHYFAWGGRTVAHVIVQTLLYVGSPFRELLNSAVYILFLLLIYKIANNNSLNLKLFIIISLMMWFFQPEFTGAVLWITGSGNYLWCTAIFLLFLCPYITLFMKETGESKGKLFATFFLPMGVIAGWTNENMSITLIIAIAALIIYFKKRSLNIPAWVYTGLIGVIIGCMLLIAAPGNYVRYEQALTPNKAPFLIFLITRFVRVLQSYFFYGLSVTLFYALVLNLHHHYGLNEQKQKRTQLSLAFFAMGIIAMLIMSGSPTLPTRIWFGIISCMIVAIAILFANLNFNTSFIKQSTRILIAFGLVMLVGQYYLGLKDLLEIRAVSIEREAIVIREKAKGNRDITFTNHLKLATDFHHTPDLDADPTDYKNELFCTFYDIDSVRVKP